ncbi:sigma-70 family RNA polymerase sigma factor [Paenibacillus albiflavus]|uniref:Sigma-70 family RNA polymerase sigma factor n=1 Tax=Paenibacillus albiflavus TaxID=2545760 RepID=A0A4R4EMJ0_9BACL|nr:sigma-70 family RNA polymerase sigma factor [Paenibacillus albiflavus]TCZ80773.1 sigma-70 family RNA polymerase sigma factor [Paenibacillus albiflavus]
MDELKLLKNLKRKKRGALDEVITIYTGYVATIVYNIIGGTMSKEDMEEVISDVFILLWNHSDKLEESRHSIKGYLGAIARNSSKNKLRGLNSNLSINEYDMLFSEVNLEEEIEQKESAALLLKAMDSMQECDREIFKRYYFNDEKIGSIAEDMKMTVSSVKTKLFRGRKNLKTNLLEKGYEYEN